MNWKKVPETQGWLQSLGEWAVRQRTFMPRMIDLEVSRVCNLDCPACMRRADSSLAQQGGEPYCTLDRFREIHKLSIMQQVRESLPSLLLMLPWLPRR